MSFASRQLVASLSCYINAPVQGPRGEALHDMYMSFATLCDLPEWARMSVAWALDAIGERRLALVCSGAVLVTRMFCIYI